MVEVEVFGEASAGDRVTKSAAVKVVVVSGQALCSERPTGAKRKVAAVKQWEAGGKGQGRGSSRWQQGASFDCVVKRNKDSEHRRGVGVAANWTCLQVKAGNHGDG